MARSSTCLCLDANKADRSQDGNSAGYKSQQYSLKLALHPSTHSIEQVYSIPLPFNNKHPFAKMVLLPVVLGGMLGLALASPLNDPPISIPTPVPSVPPFTDPIIQTAPPGIVLQPPTPALESPPFTPSDLKPKKIGYFWTGAGDNKHKGISPTAFGERWC